MTTHRKPAKPPGGGKSPGRRPAERLSRRLWLTLMAIALLFVMASCVYDADRGVTPDRAAEKAVLEADNALIKIIKENIWMLPDEIVWYVTDKEGNVADKNVVGASRSWLSGSEETGKSVSISAANQSIDMTSYLLKLNGMGFRTLSDIINALNNRVTKLTDNEDSVALQYAAKKLFSLTITY